MTKLNEKRLINDVRCLALDMIHEAGSGHPGIALGAAPLLYTLFTYHLNIDLNKSNWCNRDRFVLSCGHASSLLYALEFFVDESKYNLNDLKNYRNIYSKTPGHPEYNLENGLLNLQVLSDNFDTIKTFIPSEDVNYYSDIILNASVNSTLPFSYFSDYINKKAATGNTHSNMIQYTKSTPIGRAMANSDNEAGMINYVFITCLVFALVMLTVLFAFYLA